MAGDNRLNYREKQKFVYAIIEKQLRIVSVRWGETVVSSETKTNLFSESSF